mmetsp:Transcript_41577/g.98574  ORF Transcript_41577/g.98574 Transcript_41577/m.98574 type:complete len:308 (-) Transcript_41577:35-958(-)
MQKLHEQPAHRGGVGLAEALELLWNASRLLPLEPDLQGEARGVERARARDCRFADRDGRVLEARQDRGAPRLEKLDGEERVPKRVERVRRRVVDAAVLGPVLGELEELREARVDGHVRGEQLRLVEGEVVLHGDVEVEARGEVRDLDERDAGLQDRVCVQPALCGALEGLVVDVAEQLLLVDRRLSFLIILILILLLFFLLILLLRRRRGIRHAIHRFQRRLATALECDFAAREARQRETHRFLRRDRLNALPPPLDVDPKLLLAHVERSLDPLLVHLHLGHLPPGSPLRIQPDFPPRKKVVFLFDL